MDFSERQSSGFNPAAPKDDATPDAREMNMQEQFDAFFDSEREPTQEEMQSMMRCLLKDGSICYPFVLIQAKEKGNLKYSEEQVAQEQWDSSDVFIARAAFEKENTVDYYFRDIEGQYECGRIIQDSIVRLDQEKAIVHDLEQGTPVLVRGNWRTGKSSMVASLTKHEYGEGRDIRWSVDMFGATSVSDFQEGCAYEIDGWIAEHGLDGKEKTGDDVRQEREAEHMDPFAYLNRYLQEKKETLLLSFDEVIVLAEKEEKLLRYIASLQQYDHIKLAVVLHRYAAFEKNFADIFQGFKTHYMRSLTIAETGALVRRPLEGTKVTVTDDAIAEIHAISGGRPLEINTLCYLVFDPKSAQKRRQFFVDRDDILAEMDMSHWERRDTWRNIRNNYEKVYSKSMNDEERAIIDRLMQGEAPCAEFDAHMVQPLIDTTFVERDEQRDVYRINGTLFQTLHKENV